MQPIPGCADGVNGPAAGRWKGQIKAKVLMAGAADRMARVEARRQRPEAMSLMSIKNVAVGLSFTA
jgi:hypothetical protein